MNKFLNILVAIMCLVSMMATAREGSFSSGGYSSSSSYSPSYSSSDWGSSSSSSSSSYSSSDWSWGSSSSSWDDDDDWGFSSSSRHRSNRSSNRSYGRSNRQTTQCTNPFCPVHGSRESGRAEQHKFFLYQLYAIPADQAAYYVNVSGKATQEEKDLWTKTLYSSDHTYEKGKAPEKTEEIEKFIEAIAENKPAYIEYLQKKKAQEEAKQRRVMKAALMYGFIPMFTLMFCLIMCMKAADKS